MEIKPDTNGRINSLLSRLDNNILINAINIYATVNQMTRKPFILGIKNYEYKGTEVEHVIMGADLSCIDDLDLDKKRGRMHNKNSLPHKETWNTKIELRSQSGFGW